MSREPKNKESSGEERDDKMLDSRRDFFKKTMLGAGGLALATGSTITGCAPTVTEAATTAAPGTAAKNDWFAPAEIDLTGDSAEGLSQLSNFKSIQGDAAVPFTTPPHMLTVDKNTSGSTPGGVQALYGYNGTVPGPTFRVRGDQDLEVFLHNSLPGNNGYYAVKSDSRNVHGDTRIDPNTVDWQIDGHLYGPHQQNVTNLHTHGLHISPGKFEDSSGKESRVVQSDNVLFRIIPLEDYVNRVVKGNGPPLLDNEVVAFARYKFHLPRPDGTPHYAGTHWYHPHPHGATFDQVAGGMAGFLIVEGEIDDFIESQFTNNDYAELPLLIQRVLGPTPAQAEQGSAALKGQQQKNTNVVTTVNGQELTGGVDVIDLSPGATLKPNQVVRMRILNGSVDGKGYIRILISEGTDAPDLINPNANMYSTGKCGNPKNASAAAKRWFTDEPSSNGRLCLNNIAYDGINLIDKDGNYTDLPVEWITVGVANRADLLIHIPGDADGKTYTVWARMMEEAVDADGAKTASQNKNLNLKVGQFTVEASGSALPAPALNSDGSLNIPWNQAGKVEPYLMPITKDEITIQDNNEETDAYLPPNPVNLEGQPITMKASGNAGTAIRGRRIVYSGFGHASVAAAAFDPNETITSGDGVQNTLHTVFNAMVIDGKKYGADTSSHQGWDTAQHRMKMGTAEEWSVYNYSMTTFIKDTNGDSTDPNNYVTGIPSYKNGNGSTIDGLGANSLLRSKAVHHPFHIHQNPFYVRSIQDYEGNELLPLDDEGNPIPRWQDTVYLPHNGGRVIFRSRFWDYDGKYVNHCHLLQHEDWGMMQAVEVVNDSQKPNYIPLPLDATDKNNIFPPLSLKEMFVLDLGKVKEVLASDELKMLCYDPATTSFFNQNPVTNLTPKAVTASYYTNTSAQNQAVNQANVGYLITPVPTDTSPHPNWNNNFVSSEQII